MAFITYRMLESRDVPVSLWCGHGWGDKAFSRWHLRKPVTSLDSYPGLRAVATRRYEIVVSFHLQDGHKIDDRLYTGVGGKIDDEVREWVASDLRERTGKQVVTDLDRMRWPGLSDSNSVNYLCQGNGSLQIECTPGTCYRYRKSVPRSVVGALEDHGNI